MHSHRASSYGRPNFSVRLHHSVGNRPIEREEAVAIATIICPHKVQQHSSKTWSSRPSLRCARC